MSLIEDLNTYFDENPAEELVANPERFKIKLGIGERVYKTLRVKRTLEAIGGFLSFFSAGSTAASGSWFATTFFAPVIWGFQLSFLAVTPIGWVVAAGFAGGGLYLAFRKLSRRFDENFIDVVPKYINTPLDMIALQILEQILPFALYIARADGTIDGAERKTIEDYFTEKWGYNATVIGKYIDEAEVALTDNYVEEVATRFAKFCKESKDCDKAEVTDDVNKMLQAIVDADDHIHPDEEKALNQLKSWFES